MSGRPDPVPTVPPVAARGVFVTVEGVEGAGKTTQVALLAERLRGSGREVLVVREPGGTPLAEEARRLVLDPALDLGAAAELFLMLVARADLVHHVVRPALARGDDGPGGPLRSLDPGVPDRRAGTAGAGRRRGQPHSRRAAWRPTWWWSWTCAPDVGPGAPGGGGQAPRPDGARRRGVPRAGSPRPFVPPPDPASFIWRPTAPAPAVHEALWARAGPPFPPDLFPARGVVERSPRPRKAVCRVAAS